MDKIKEPGTVDSVVATLFEGARAHIASLSTGANLALAEIKMAFSHAGLIVCLAIVAAGLILVGWGLLLMLVAVLLMTLGWSTAWAVFCVFLVNVIALLVTGLIIRSSLKHLSFRHTRQAFTPDNADALSQDEAARNRASAFT